MHGDPAGPKLGSEGKMAIWAKSYGVKRTMKILKIQEKYSMLSDASKNMCMCLLILSLSCEVIFSYKYIPKCAFL